MIIDFHTHIRENKGNVEDFIQGMDDNGIDIAVVHPIIPGSDSLGYSDNEFVGNLIKKYPKRLLGFACVIPTEPNASEELKDAIERYGFKGLKLHPPIQNFSMADERIYPVVETCIDLDIPILVHTGPIYSPKARVCYSSSLPIDDLAIRYPEAKIIIAHGDPLSMDPFIVAKHTNVYLDTTITLARMLRLFPQLGEDIYESMRRDDRIIFGTDANPLRVERFAYNLEPLMKINISDESRNKLLCENARKLLKI